MTPPPESTVPPRLLLVDDDEEACRLLAEVLSRESYDVTRALSVTEALALVDRGPAFDAVLTDLRMPEASGLDLLAELRRRNPEALVLVLTAFSDATGAAAAIRAGAYDFISKPYDLAELRQTLSRALSRRQLASTRGMAPKVRTDTTGGNSATLVGHSPAIITVMKQVARVAPSQATVLITGETGTGKELVARTIHRFSDRSEQRMVSVNCSALAEGLLESELFGHIKGSFTGATTNRAGLFREADQGTIFLDEIGDISPGLQSRLLRVLQEQEIVPVGAETPVKVDVRVIAATHRDLPSMVRERTFREDLYYRLNVVTIPLPALRERRHDIPLLIDYFLNRLSARHGRGPVAIDPAAQSRLLTWSWPGNVRELENVLERALVLAELDVIGPEHLPPGIGAADAAPGAPPSAAVATSGVNDAGELVTLDELDRRHVFRVLEVTGGNREESARILGISRRTLTRMIQRWAWKSGEKGG
jgi:DNA-binding NtrC family response regulator